MEQGIRRRWFSHFGYPSDSEPDHEPVEESVEETMVFPELDDMEPLFSEREEILREPAGILLPSPTGTSAPLLSNPALTE